ncbi:DMT family transporter [Deinococcus sonorensis]|uniref:DMT family transporter n=2 Tax=Deinococcus sonorensis TaxID=309891 RepID=A0AAU7U5W9_9DEIO
MSVLLMLGTLGAGLGLSAGLAFNLRLANALGTPLAATLVNFLVGAALLVSLWVVGLDGARPTAWPAPWMLMGGLLGAAYVTLSLMGAARLGVAVSTVAVTLGQMLGAMVIGSTGWFQQPAGRPALTAVISAALLVAAVVVVSRDRQTAAAGSADTARNQSGPQHDPHRSEAR